MKERPILFSAPMVRAILEGTKTQTRRVVKVRGEQPPEWATFAQEGSSLNVCGPRPSGLFYWSEEQAVHGPLKTLRRWPTLWPKHPMAGDHYWTPCPYGQPGDRLYVREHWRASSAHDALPPRDIPPGDSVEFLADAERVLTGKDRRAFHMPRWASRILLEIVSVRVERLQEITNDDARAEGPEYAHPHRHGTEGLEWEPHPGEIVRDPYAARHNTGWNDCWICAYRQIWQDINGPGSWDANPWVWVIEFKRVESAASAARS